MAKEETARSKPKLQFSSRSLQALIRKIHGDPTLLKKDWRDTVRGHFRLSSEQEKSLVGTHPRKVKKIQRYLAKAASHIRRGGTVKAKLVKRSMKDRTKQLVYDVAVDFVRAKSPRGRKT